MRNFYILIVGLGFMLVFILITAQNNILLKSIALKNGGGSSLSLKDNTNSSSTMSTSASTLTGSGSEHRDTSVSFNYDPTSNTIGGGDGDFDFLTLINLVKNGSKNLPDAEYYLQLIEMYTRTEQGKNNNFENNPSAGLLAASHKNETNWDDFVKNAIGKTIDGRVVSLMVSDKEMVEALLSTGAISRSGSVWKDANGDGYPDGPFQVESGRPDSWLKAIAIDSKKTTFDVYSFRDQMNNVALRFDEAVKKLKENDISMSKVELDMYGVVQHNRGSQTKQAWGLAYEASSPRVKVSDYLKINQNGKEDLQEQVKIINILRKAYLTYNISFDPAYLETNANAGVLAWLMLLKDGWFIEEWYDDMPFNIYLKKLYERNINNPDKNPAIIMFPAWNTYEKARDDIKQNYVKSLPEALSSTASQVDKWYGTYNGSYRGAVLRAQGSSKTSYYFIYKNEQKKNPEVYKDETTPQVKAYDFVSCAYFVNAGMFGENALITLALKTGKLDKLDGEIIDPTNPKIFYKNKTDTYNPVYGANNSDFDGIVSALGITFSHDTQYYGLLETYKACGDLYSQAGGTGTWFNDSGGRNLDCSSLASVNMSLGNFEDNGKPSTLRNSSGWYQSVGQAKSQEYNNKIYDTTLLQVLEDGKNTATAYDYAHRKQHAEWGKVLQPGDVIARNTNEPGGGHGSGHAIVFLGINNTNTNITLTAEQTKTGKAKTFKPGDAVWLEAQTYGVRNGIQSTWDKSNTFAAYRMKASN